MSDLRAEIGRILSRFACDKDINGQMQTERCKDEIEKLIEQEVSDLKSKLAGECPKEKCKHWIKEIEDCESTYCFRHYDDNYEPTQSDKGE